METLLSSSTSTELTSRPDFTELLVLLKNAKNGCWVFVLYNNLAAREEVVAAVKRFTRPVPVVEWTYTPEQPNPTSYLQLLTPAQQTTNAVAFFFDMERGGDAAWKSLDYYRETLSEHPHAIVIWVSQAGRIAAARKAPHFWAQRSMVFDFTVTAPEQHLELLGSWVGQDFAFATYDEAIRQLRIQQGLLDDYLGLPDPPLRIVADLHRKVAQTLNFLDRRAEALPHLHELLSLAEKMGDDELKAEALTNLAEVERIHSGAPTAITLLEQAYLLAHSPHLRTSIAYNLGATLMTQGQPERSMKLLTEAQQLFEQVGAKLGQANVLKAIGDVQYFRKEIEAALESYAKAQQLFEQVGAKLGQANVLQAIGDVQYFRKEIEAALESYAKAQQLFEQVGAKLGQANVLLSLGRLTQNRDQFEEAIRLYEQVRDRYNIARAQYYYALFLIDANELKQAEALLLKARDTFAILDVAAGVDAIGQALQRLHE